jgi:hypothetical protein
MTRFDAFLGFCYALVGTAKRARSFYLLLAALVGAD